MDESESLIWVLPFSSLELQSDSELGAALLIKVTKDLVFPLSPPLPLAMCLQLPTTSETGWRLRLTHSPASVLHFYSTWVNTDVHFTQIPPEYYTEEA